MTNEEIIKQLQTAIRLADFRNIRPALRAAITALKKDPDPDPGRLPEWEAKVCGRGKTSLVKDGSETYNIMIYDTQFCDIEAHLTPRQAVSAVQALIYRNEVVDFLDNVVRWCDRNDREESSMFKGAFFLREKLTDPTLPEVEK